jgi:tetratricopeptide (TPR) repeat protein
VRLAWLSVVALVLVAGLPGNVGALTREEARAALGDTASAEHRRRGALELGQLGTMADVPALVRALTDDDVEVRGIAENALWQVWSRSGDAGIDSLFATGVEQMTLGRLAESVETFTRIIQQRPDFAEGWNKRATAYYLLGDYPKSLADCDEVLKRNPHHFGALSGYGMIYLQLDQPARALDYFQRALAVNPNLRQVEEAVEALKAMLVQRRRETL